MRNILIVDDDSEFCEEFAESLASEGYCVDASSDPCKGEALIRNGRYDIIFLDIKMQERTGIDILKKVKAENINKNIFVITGKPSVKRVLEKDNLSDAVNGIIAKPVNFIRLLTEIEKATF